jgi:hypothetical protein
MSAELGEEFVLESAFDATGYAIIISTREYLDVEIDPCDVVCIDGNTNLLKFHPVDKKNQSVVMIGTVKNGKRDPSHSYNFMSLGILSTEEGKDDSRKFLDLVSELRSDDVLDNHTNFMTDGSGGFRGAMEERAAALLRIAMCWVQLRVNLLPQKKFDLWQALHDLRMIADTPTEYHERVWEAVDFTQSEDEFMKKLAGWWVDFLGKFSTRTNCAQEAMWSPLAFFFEGKRVSVLSAIRIFTGRFLPYLQQNCTKATSPVLTLPQRQAAVALACEDKDKLLKRGDECFCKKRILGSGRPQITQLDADLFEDILTRQVWSYADVAHVTSIRKFGTKSCNCADMRLYGKCLHARAAQIDRGEVTPAPLEQPIPENELRPIHSSVRNIDRESYCAICGKDCQNEHNRAEHVAGKKHLIQMYSCFLECEKAEKSFQLKNGNTFERVRAKDLRARDIVIITADAEIRQVIQCLVTGVVHGRRAQVNVYMSTSSRSEIALTGASWVYRLQDKAGDRQSYFKPPTPRSRFARGSPHETRQTSCFAIKSPNTKEALLSRQKDPETDERNFLSCFAIRSPNTQEALPPREKEKETDERNFLSNREADEADEEARRYQTEKASKEGNSNEKDKGEADDGTDRCRCGSAET